MNQIDDFTSIPREIPCPEPVFIPTLTMIQERNNRNLRIKELDVKTHMVVVKKIIEDGQNIPSIQSPQPIRLSNIEKILQNEKNKK